MSGKKKKGRKVGGGSSSPVQVSQKAVLGGKRLLKKQLGYTLAIQIAVLGTVSFVPEVRLYDCRMLILFTVCVSLPHPQLLLPLGSACVHPGEGLQRCEELCFPGPLINCGCH